MISLALLALILSVVTILYRLIIYPAFLSPLSRVPSAHPLASITPAWITWIRYRSRENTVIFDAHERLGPVVRLSPDEVSVNCYEGGLKPVYSASFEKHDFYPRLFTNFGGVLNIFSTKLNKPHSARKRLVTHVYAKSYLQNSPSIAAQSQHLIYKRILPKLQQLVSSEYCVAQCYPYSYVDGTVSAAAKTQYGGLVNVYPLFCGITMDFVTAYLFGLSRSSNFIEDEKTCMWWCHNFVDRKPWSFWPAELPNLSTWLEKLGLLRIPGWVSEANQALDDWAMKMCDATQKSLTTQPTEKELESPENEPVVYRQLSEAMAVTKPPQDPEQLRMNVASDMHDHLAAGDETSLITLLFLFYELSRHPNVQGALRSELATLDPPIRLPSQNSDVTGDDTLPSLPSPKEIDALPLLHAVFMETLRLHAPIPGPQPRVTPMGGCMLGPPPSEKSLGPNGCNQNSQYFIPGNVRVSANAYALHRIPHVFPQPERWLLGRWLPGFSLETPNASGLSTASSTASPPSPEDEARFREMNRYFWAFSSGGHMCLGNNFATQTIKLVVAAIVSNFRVEAVEKEGGGEVVLEQEDAWTAQPVEKRLVLRFVEIK